MRNILQQGNIHVFLVLCKTRFTCMTIHDTKWVAHQLCSQQHSVEYVHLRLLSIDNTYCQHTCESINKIQVFLFIVDFKCGPVQTGKQNSTNTSEAIKGACHMSELRFFIMTVTLAELCCTYQGKAAHTACGCSHTCPRHWLVLPHAWCWPCLGRNRSPGNTAP